MGLCDPESDDQGPTQTLDWLDVSFAVPDSQSQESGATKQILHKMSGSAQSGRMLAIMGSSGAGKTSFLNILAGKTQRKDRPFTKGALLLNSRKIVPGNKSVAFVEQHDTLMSTDTPKEAIEFSARLRLPATTPSSKKGKHGTSVGCIMRLLGLEKCKDVPIGDDRLKGISGGEKRRVSIGVEIISDPTIVFLDEPTSGLDFVTALSVVKTMQRLARSGKIVIATIHQPSSEIFHLFDDLLLLHHGKIAYHGPVLEAEEHFEQCGLPCPNHYNPADHYLSVLSKDEEVSKIIELTEQKRSAKLELLEVKSHGALPQLPKPKGPAPGICTQMRYLIAREVRTYYRDPTGVLGNTLVALFFGVLFGLFYQGAGARQSPIQDVKGSLFISQQLLFSGVNTMLMRGVSGRSIFDREHRVGTYSIVAYMMSTIVVALPMLIVNTLASGLPWLYLIGWQGNYWLYLLVLFEIVCVGFAWGLVIGLVAGRADLAALAIPFIIVPQVFIAGMYRASTGIPAYLRWAQWGCIMKHGYSALLCLEMNDQNHPGITEDFKRENLERNYINPENPQQDFVFYATLPVVIYAALIIAGMVYLKISAMRR